MPEISIVLPTYNGAKYIKESIESILTQSFTDWELIIVNDCSTDNTPTIVESYATRDSRIRVIHNEQNLKLPASLNVGFREARGRYFTWTSDDNAYVEDALREMYLVLEKQEDVPMVVADMIAIDEQNNYVYDWQHYAKGRMAYNNAVGACFLYRREVVDKIGGYDEEAFLLEDYEYWYRVLINCGDIVRIPEILYRYRIHSASLSDARAADIRNRLMEFRRLNFTNLMDLCEEEPEYGIALFAEMEESGALTEENRAVFMNRCKLIPAERKYTKGEPIAIYGAGKYGCRLSKLVENVVCFIDSDESKRGSSINGIEVLSLPDYLDSKTDTTIVVAVHHRHMYSVLQKLNEVGIKYFCLYYDVLSSCGFKEGCLEND